jgi:predicted ester cyclase
VAHATRYDYLQEVEQTTQLAPPFQRVWGLLAGLLIIALIGYSWWSTAADPHRSQAQETTIIEQRQPALPQVGVAAPQGWWQSPQAVAAENKRRLWQLYQQGLSTESQPFASDFRYTETGIDPAGIDLATFEQRLTAQKGTIYDLSYRIETMIADETQVAVYWQAIGTPTQSFETHPPTGQPITWRGVTIWHISEGRVVAAETVGSQKFASQAVLHQE